MRGPDAGSSANSHFGRGVGRGRGSPRRPCAPTKVSMGLLHPRHPPFDCRPRPIPTRGRLFSYRRAGRVAERPGAGRGPAFPPRGRSAEPRRCWRLSPCGEAGRGALRGSPPHPHPPPPHSARIASRENRAGALWRKRPPRAGALGRQRALYSALGEGAPFLPTADARPPRKPPLHSPGLARTGEARAVACPAVTSTRRPWALTKLLDQPWLGPPQGLQIPGPGPQAGSAGQGVGLPPEVPWGPGSGWAGRRTAWRPASRIPRPPLHRCMGLGGTGLAPDWERCPRLAHHAAQAATFPPEPCQALAPTVPCCPLGPS